MHLSTIVTLLSAGGAIAMPGAPRSTKYALKERHNVPRGWKEISRASKDHLINLQIGLKQGRQDEIDQHVIETSDPTHERYGQHLSAADIDRLIEPSKDTLSQVKAWLAEHDVSDMSFSPSKDWINVRLPVEKVEKMLQTAYSHFEHTDGTTLVRAPEWSLPEHLHEHIDLIQPTNAFFRPTKQSRDVVVSEAFDLKTDGIDMEEWKEHYQPHHGKPPHHGPPGYGPPGHYDPHHEPTAAEINAICNVTFTDLKCIRTLYGTIDYEAKVPHKNSIGTTNYLRETSVRSDIYQYLSAYRPEAKEVANTFEIEIVANGDNQQTPLNATQVAAGQDIEGNLDAELVLGISWPTKYKAWNTGGSPPFKPDLATPTDTNEPYLVWLNQVLGERDVPNVISTSYGDDEQTIPYSYAKRACDGFKQLGARGVSVLFSSGDNGVGSDGDCFSNDGKNTSMFLPAFPAGCPWVTAVGGTANFTPEVAVSRFGSGAGFSNYFGMPQYQVSAVEGYFDKIGDLYKGQYNKKGRGYPDVAAQGNHDVIVWNGKVRTVGGTSASSPTFAAVIALVNDALIAAGKPALGFLNPWIYGGAYKALTDVTSGSAIGCDVAGFPATTGWDAVTGFGTPNFKKLVKAAFEKEGHQGWGWGHKGHY